MAREPAVTRTADGDEWSAVRTWLDDRLASELAASRRGATAAERKELRRRTVFHIVRYDRKVGPMFVAYVSMDERSVVDTVFQRWYVDSSGGSFEVVTREAHGFPGGPRWERVEGEPVGRLPRPAALLRLKESDDPDDVTDCDAIADTVARRT